MGKTSSHEVKFKTDAIELLTADHRKVERLFNEYDRVVANDGSHSEKEAVVAAICTELTIHTQVEEEIFYPAAREALKDEDLVDEAIVEHASVKDLIIQLAETSPDDDLYDAKVKVLSELVEHHVNEEEGEMFSKLKRTKLDRPALGAQMLDRKQQLIEELGLFTEEAALVSS